MSVFKTPKVHPNSLFLSERFNRFRDSTSMLNTGEQGSGAGSKMIKNTPILVIGQIFQLKFVGTESSKGLSQDFERLVSWNRGIPAIAVRVLRCCSVAVSLDMTLNPYGSEGLGFTWLSITSPNEQMSLQVSLLTLRKYAIYIDKTVSFSQNSEELMT